MWTLSLTKSWLEDESILPSGWEVTTEFLLPDMGHQMVHLWMYPGADYTNEGVFERLRMMFRYRGVPGDLEEVEQVANMVHLHILRNPGPFQYSGELVQNMYAVNHPYQLPPENDTLRRSEWAATYELVVATGI